MAAICSGDGGLIGGGAALGKDFRNAGMGFQAFGGERRAEDERPRSGMTRCGAVVDQRVVLLFFQEVGNIGHADFEFEGGGDAVEGFDALAREVLAMLMEIDETGCDDETFYGDCSLGWSGSAEIRAILPLRMPTLRMASRLVSGSMTRPPSRTRSYCWAKARVERIRKESVRRVRMGWDSVVEEMLSPQRHREELLTTKDAKVSRRARRRTGTTKEHEGARRKGLKRSRFAPQCGANLAMCLPLVSRRLGRRRSSGMMLRPMNREYHKGYSQELHREMELWCSGMRGRPYWFFRLPWESSLSMKTAG